jgi:DNA-directed RNA polymerase subunit RPC12/RpoP
MPDGVRVEERRVGRAVAQWVLQVRCECGRRWFEVDAVDTVTCPRCGVKVYVDIDARSARRREIGCEP